MAKKKSKQKSARSHEIDVAVDGSGPSEAPCGGPPTSLCH